MVGTEEARLVVVHGNRSPTTFFTVVAAYASGSMVGFGYAFPCTPEY
jgi:hypothetical protein